MSSNPPLAPARSHTELRFRFRPPPAQALPEPVYRDTMRVYYEDTDAGGIVYHANYLRYFERARTDWLRSLGAEQRDIAEREGLMFVVRDVAMEFRSPARLDDRLDIDVRITQSARASLRLAQVASHAVSGAVLVVADVRIAVIDRNARPVALPAWLLAHTLPRERS